MILKHLTKLVPLIALLPAGNASAALLSLQCVTNNNADACAIGEQQLQIDVTESAQNNGVNILFTNIDNNDLTINGIDPNPSIHEIYFDTTEDIFPNTFSFSSIGVTPSANDSTSNVRFGDLEYPDTMTPRNLPGGNEVGFEASFGIESFETAGSGIDEGGIDAGEWLNLNIARFSYDAFMLALNAGDLTIGLHVRSFDGGIDPLTGEEVEFSESFVTSTRVSAVPVPAAFWLFGSALIGFIGMSRKARA